MSAGFDTVAQPDFLVAAILSDPSSRMCKWEQGALPSDIVINTTSTNIFTGQFTMPPQGTNYCVYICAMIQLVATGAATARVFLTCTGTVGATREQDVSMTATLNTFPLFCGIMQGACPPGQNVTYAVTATCNVAATITAKALGLAGSPASNIIWISFPAPFPL